jgi:hypothetical protein
MYLTLQKGEYIMPIPEIGIANGAQTVTPADSNTTSLFRRLYIGTGGNLNVKGQDGTDVILVNVPSGFIIDFGVVRVSNTNTTASNIVGFL